ncbi:hypothetical protein CFR78_01595 [Komagataeibacter rhaeticus]|uniref:hypothetical protein n=1 Tax=Komagataeibacter rhaeticus TaxID=215221 RepID=UPI0004D34361|nr:hypothetical protein [Komagataeibacter rhaeticus]KDU94865.1 hypothetical protein GLUCORHAEAF1_11295 [Komagataeibacter rhaeticus AF1]MBL7239337.1 hypothetical protein [Komagataeibacter rhaeticus]PYD55120.1 hypothetical protein CFR78_01595 [Komagataeibacter rhaeticus]GBQ16456.1 hypothetical protein AA16663_2414 [Komagataeibacter rhaeticus DSM 16663]
MRAFHGQMSDNQPIRRTLAEKQKQLRDLRETLATMKSHTAPALRESVQKRIRQLESEVNAAPALRAGEKRPAPGGTAPGDRPRSPRRRPERGI